MRSVLLKLVATAVTLSATVASALFVTSHLKNPSAPLQPAVLESSTTAAGVVVVGPAAQPTSEPPITSTYAS